MSTESSEEYTDLSENLRHYNTQYLALLTITLALTGALVSTVFSSSAEFSNVQSVLLKAAGISLSLMFWIIGEIFIYRYKHFEARLVELEQSLGYRQYSTLLEVRKDRWFAKLPVGRIIWGCLHAFIAFFWIITLFA